MQVAAVLRARSLRPPASTASTGAGSTSASSPGSAAKASASSAGHRRQPVEIARPAVDRRPGQHLVEHRLGARRARSPSRSVDDSSPMRRLLAERARRTPHPPGERSASMRRPRLRDRALRRAGRAAAHRVARQRLLAGPDVERQAVARRPAQAGPLEDDPTPADSRWPSRIASPHRCARRSSRWLHKFLEPRVGQIRPARRSRTKRLRHQHPSRRRRPPTQLP